MLLKLGIEELLGTTLISPFQQHAGSLEKNTPFEVILRFY